MIAVFVVGYLLFVLLLQSFGVTDLINEHFNEKLDSYLSSSGIAQRTEIVPDLKSSPLTLSKEELGKMTWGLFHSIAATYPLESDENYKKALEDFLNSL